MGEYSIFVWPSYAAVLIILGVIGIQSWLSKRKDEKELEISNRKFQKLSDQE
jgi:heme exporter protein CcmD